MRSVNIWLPEGFPAAQKYAVLFMHNGQMLFDGSITWNQQEWRVDKVAQRSMASLKPFKYCEGKFHLEGNTVFFCVISTSFQRDRPEDYA